MRVRAGRGGEIQEHLFAVEDELNIWGRMLLQDRCPADLFAVMLASNIPSVLDVD